MPDLVIPSLEGGLSTRSPTALLDNQCAYAVNVEWWKTKCGERRNGSTQVTFAGSDLEGCDRIVWLYEHWPSTDYADTELWALGLDDLAGTPAAVLAYKDTSWHTVSVGDAFTLDGVSEYRVSGQTLHGKLFLAYNSAVDRLHVWDGTSLRRTGLAEPAAPTCADTGSGSLAGLRYYRVRYTVQSGGVTLRRSEPSDSLAFTPSGSGTHARVTKPASISESETHWELEASTNDVDFYVIATTAVGTTTYDDDTDTTTGTYAAFPLSEDVGDYTLIPSAKYLSVDGDRLMAAGSWEDADEGSRVRWTPVLAAPGVGNDERLEADTDPYADLDTYEGGNLTGLSRNINGYLYATKFGHIYQGLRTGVRTRAYEWLPLTKSRGVLPGTLVEGLDNQGFPSLFALDPSIGPIRIGGRGGGVETCGSDLIEVWSDSMATALTNAGAQTAVYVPEKRQVQFWLAGTGVGLILHTQHMRLTEEGFRGGWAVWTRGDTVYAASPFATNINAAADRALFTRPVLGVTSGTNGGTMQLTDTTATTDNGTAFAATIATRQYVLDRYLHDLEAKELVVTAVARTNAQVKITIKGYTPSVGVAASSTSTVTLTPASGEGALYHYDYGFGLRYVDDIGHAEIKSISLVLEDVTTPGAQWGIEALALTVSGGQRAG